MPEQWLPVLGWETDYSISSLGQVRRERPAKGSWAGRILKPHTGDHGYQIVTLGHASQRLVHVLVLEAFRGPRPPGSVANHRNGVKANNRLENLEWTTYGGNNAHAYRMGLKHGPPRKLSAEAVAQIRASAELHRVLAERFSVNQSQISRIRAGKRRGRD